MPWSETASFTPFGWIDNASPDLDAANLKSAENNIASWALTQLNSLASYVDTHDTAGGDASGTTTNLTVNKVMGGHVPLRADLNLSDLVAVATARFNLGVQPADLAQYGVVYDAQHLTNCSWTTGTGALVDSSSSGKFKSTDVGKVIVIKGAGAGTGGVLDLATTIASFTDANHVTTTATTGTTVSGALVAWGSDQTSNLQAAANAGVPLLMPAGKEIMTQQITVAAGFSLDGRRGAKIWSTGTGTGNGCIFKLISSDGVTLNQGFRLVGTELHGWSAVNSVSNTPIWLQQWQGIYIEGCVFDGHQQGLNFEDCSQGYVLNNRISNMSGGSNAIDIHDSSTGNATNLPITEWFCMGNGINNATASGIDITIGYTIPTTPTRAVITNNRIYMNSSFSCVSLEIGIGSGYAGGSTPGKIQDVIIANNILRQDGTGYCIVIEDDGSTGSSASDKLMDIQVSNNICTATGTTQGTIGLQGLRVLCEGNILNISGSKNGIYCASSPASNASNHIKIRGNEIANSGTGFSIYVNNSNDVQIEGNRMEQSGTAVYAVQVTNSNRIDVIENRVNNSDSISIFLSNVGDYNIERNKIYNTNAGNHTGGTAGTGIVITNAAGQGGSNNLIEGNKIWDDRTTHQMQYAVQNTNTAGTLPRLMNNKMYGCVVAPTTNAGTSFLRIKGNDTDQGSWPAQPTGVTLGASPATYTNSDPWDEVISIYGGSGVSLVQISVDGGTTFSTISGTTNQQTLLKGGGQGALKVTYSTTAPSATKTPIP